MYIITQLSNIFSYRTHKPIFSSDCKNQFSQWISHPGFISERSMFTVIQFHSARPHRTALSLSNFNPELILNFFWTVGVGTFETFGYFVQYAFVFLICFLFLLSLFLSFDMETSVWRVLVSYWNMWSHNMDTCCLQHSLCLSRVHASIPDAWSSLLVAKVSAHRSLFCPITV